MQVEIFPRHLISVLPGLRRRESAHHQEGCELHVRGHVLQATDTRLGSIVGVERATRAAQLAVQAAGNQAGACARGPVFGFAEAGGRISFNDA